MAFTCIFKPKIETFHTKRGTILSCLKNRRSKSNEEAVVVWSHVSVAVHHSMLVMFYESNVCSEPDIEIEKKRLMSN